MTGVMNPKGSKMVEVHFRISQLVVAAVKGVTFGLAMNRLVSHHTPIILPSQQPLVCLQ